MNFAKLDDQQLVKLYISGNEEAFEVLILRHKNRVYNYIFMMVKNEALTEDIFQDAFIKIIKTLKGGRYNEEGKFLPWVMRICHNLVIDHFRKNKKMRMISESSSKNEDFNIFDILPLSDSNVEDEIVLDEIANHLETLVATLPESQRKVVEMRIYKGMSFKDIAEEEDVSINTALGRMRYALINLRRIIEEKDITVIS
ncbi:MAG: sigma-70 family RNA polymerase sigma factor [Crocinitomicaceae bacterium]|nr:sigma-70 family RNA polymerase sigma factor [Crocinitomicaceae bacterium]